MAVTYMAVPDQFLLLFSGLGGIHGLLLAIYLCVRQPGKWSNPFLAGVIFMLSIRVLKSVLFHFNPVIGKQILQLGLSACFLIGPLLYCYCLQYIGKFPANPRLALHFVLPTLLVTVTGILYPYHLNAELWGGLFYKTINYTWLIYIGLSVVLLWPQLSALDKTNWRQKRDLVIVFCMVLGNSIIWCAYYFAAYTSYIAGALSFSFLLAAGALTFFLRSPAAPATDAYANKKIASADAEPLIAELLQVMTTRQPYLDANLALPKLAKSMGWPSPKLSQLLNDNLQQTFNDFVNAYRIEHAKTLLTSNAAMKMDDLAHSSGFNSLSTFYTAFKKHAALTPAKFKALRLNSNAENSEIINP